MNLTLLVAVAAASGAALAYVLSPLIAPPQLSEENEPDEGREVLLQRRASAYLAIRELEADYQQGKVDATAYAAARAELEASAITIMRALDTLNAGTRSVK